MREIGPQTVRACPALQPVLMRDHRRYMARIGHRFGTVVVTAV